MIKINLLPEELSQKKAARSFLPQAKQLLIYILPAAFGLLLAIHLLLAGLFLIKSVQYKALNSKWTKFSVERQEVNEWKRQYNFSSQQSEQVNKLLIQRITVSDKMQSLLGALPSGVWFNRLNLKEKEFSLKGSVVFLESEQMRMLNLFLSQLKKDKSFFKDFISLELGRVKMRTLGAYSIMDFTLEGKLK